LAAIADLSPALRLFVRAYRWRKIDPVPFMPLRRPLSECRLALVSSAGFVLPGQAPFDSKVAGGDTSFREIPAGADLSELSESHRSSSFDHEGIRRDPNLAVPLDRLRELVRSRRLGELAPRHLSFMGSITAPGRLVRHSAPEAAARLAADAVHAALLVPV
jgi:D-proline reductase (dithiol) PrdB